MHNYSVLFCYTALLLLIVFLQSFYHRRREKRLATLKYHAENNLVLSLPVDFNFMCVTLEFKNIIKCSYSITREFGQVIGYKLKENLIQYFGPCGTCSCRFLNVS